MPAPKDPAKYEEYCKHISDAKKGIPLSEEHKQKLRESNKGGKNGFYGKHHNPETKKKIGAANKRRVVSEETRKKMSESQKGKKLFSDNGAWKGDVVTKGALHDWIHYNMPKPKLCLDCGESKRLDVHNISGEYTRNIDDWVYICRRCHMIRDGRLDKMLARNKKCGTNIDF